MALIPFAARGFLINRNGVEVKFSKNGNAYARLPLVFKNRRKVGDEWVSDKEMVVDGTIFGKQAEVLADLVTGMQDLNVSGELYTEEYEGKLQVKANIFSAWPAKEEDRQPVSASRASASNDLPF